MKLLSVTSVGDFSPLDSSSIPSSALYSNTSMAEVEYVAHVVVMPIVLTIGMINQCLNVCTLLQLPSGGFLYLKASAIADILSIISFIPFLLRHADLINTRSRVEMLYHAHLELPIINALIAASAFCIVAMTVDRYLSICHPIQFFNTSDSKRRTKKVIAMLYFLAFLIYVPSICQKELVPSKDESLRLHFEIVRNHDVEDGLPFQVYLLFRELASRWGPVVLLVILNAAMIRSLHQLEKKQLRRSLKARQGRNSREDRSRISALLLVTSTTFVLCNLPASFLSLFVRRAEDNDLFWQTFKATSNLLQVTSYLYNFYLYALCSSEYREAFLGLIGCRRQTSPITTGDSPTVRLSTNIPKKMPLLLMENGHHGGDHNNSLIL
ncbi:unnamed protein product [Auanema sp. JU1783]|nr:unnamed protein product [Auanema sp. JU1783]